MKEGEKCRLEAASATAERGSSMVRLTACHCSRVACQLRPARGDERLRPQEESDDLLLHVLFGNITLQNHRSTELSSGEKISAANFPGSKV